MQATRRRLRAALACGAFSVVGIVLLPSPAIARGACSPDPSGDTEVFFSGDAPEADRADVVEHCAEYGDGLGFAIRTTESFDPMADPAWTYDSTRTAVFIDTTPADGVEQTNFVLEFRRTMNGLFAYQLDGEGTEVCPRAPAGHIEGWLLVLELDPACYGSPEALSYSLFTAYDTYPDSVPESAHATDTTDAITIERYGTRDIERVAGDTRISTAIRIAERAFPTGAPTVYLARSDVFFDAVAAGSLTDGPVLLVPPCGDAPPEVRASVERLDPDEVVVLGGHEAVCEQEAIEIANGRRVDRISGNDRVDTAIAIARRAFPGGAPAVFLARSDDLIDAVSAGTLSEGPILLVPSCDFVPPQVREVTRDMSPDEVLAIGGPLAICDEVLHAVASAVEPEPATEGRLAGDDRFGTAAAISARQFPGGSEVAYISRADVFADAVAAGSLTDGPLLLVPRCGGPSPATAAEISRLSPATIGVLGGESAVCDLTAGIAATVGT